MSGSSHNGRSWAGAGVVHASVVGVACALVSAGSLLVGYERGWRECAASAQPESAPPRLVESLVDDSATRESASRLERWAADAHERTSALPAGAPESGRGVGLLLAAMGVVGGVACAVGAARSTARGCAPAN